MLEAEEGTRSRSCGMAVRLHGHYRKGLLPVAGGVLEQPWLAMAAIETVERVVVVWEREQMETARAGDDGQPKARIRRIG